MEKKSYDQLETLDEVLLRIDTIFNKYTSGTNIFDKNLKYLLKLLTVYSSETVGDSSYDYKLKLSQALSFLNITADKSQKDINVSVDNFIRRLASSKVVFILKESSSIIKDGEEGDVYYNTTLDSLFLYRGNKYINIGTYREDTLYVKMYEENTGLYTLVNGNLTNLIKVDAIPLSGTAEGKPLKGTIITDLNDKPIFQEIGEEVEQGLRDNKEFILSENKVGYSVNYTKNGETIVMSNIFQVLPGGNVIGSIGFLKLKGHELSSTDIRFTSQGIDLNVENGGYILCNVDYTEVSLTSSDDKLLAQRSYVTKTIGNFKLPTNWESPQQRFSGLVDKSTDATYDKVMILDNNGNAGTKDVGDLGKVKTVNNQEPDENGDIPLDYIPLTGTEEGKPLTGSIEINSELSEPLFKRGESSPIGSYSESLTFNNVFNYNNYDQSSGRTVVSVITAGMQIGEKVKSVFGHSISNSGNGIYGSLNIIDGLASMAFSEGVTSPYNMNDLRPNDYNMFAQRSYVMKLLGNYWGSTNWTSSEQQFSGLLDKSQDATYNKVMILDNNGNAGVKNLNSDTLIDILTNSTPEQLDAIRQILYPQI